MDVTAVLLKIVETSGSLGALNKMGYTYSQISIMISRSIDEGLLSLQDDRLIITQTGIERIKKYKESRITQGKSEWIKPQREYRVTKKSKYDIVFPRKF